MQASEGSGAAAIVSAAPSTGNSDIAFDLFVVVIDVRKRLVTTVVSAYNDVMDFTHLDADRCYAAVTTRDARFDGLFFTAVNTTGIYCRPVCAARTPKRSSCDFFQTAAAAESAGFRPCLRCRPELAPGRADFNETLAAAILARLQAGALDEGSSETLGREIGLSSRQVRRILLEHFGVTPIEVAQTQRLLFAKKLLQETELPMTQIALSSGFRSLRRFNTSFRERYGLAPSTLRREGRGPTDDAREPKATSLGNISLRLAYRPPLDWPGMLRYLAGRATKGVEAVQFGADSATYLRTATLTAGERTVSGWLAVREPNAAEAAKKGNTNVLLVTVSASLAPVLMPVMHRLRQLFDLDANPTRIALHLKHDALLLPALAASPGLRVPGAWDRFELALRAVLGQQVSVAGATTLSGRLAARFGVPIATPYAALERSAPKAATLARADLADIAAIGLPNKRAATIRELARFAANDGLNFAPGTQLDDAVAALDALPGIGPWTAQYIAMRALRFADAFPAGDLGLRKALKELESTDHLPTEAALLRRAEAWRPWRAYAAAYLWHSLSSSKGPQP